ncbi:MAG: class I SAM-dependent methyltransferase [Bacteroidota bacterium]|nr:class I SAM-dependent methyltransferase [Bacteroidota bacterium]
MQSIRSGGGSLKPPRRLIYTGGGDFLQTGQDFMSEFVELGLLKSDSIVLDVGSGIGRMAIPLTSFVKNGKYEGFDIMAAGVKWCQKNITTQYPNFNFTLVDLSNDLYRNHGGSADQFQFPYQANLFDLVVVISVFTHMIALEVKNYSEEIYRVLKPGGKCFATFFILNEQSRVEMIRGENDFNFMIQKENYSLIDELVKSANVAYDEDYITNSIFPKDKFVFETIKFGKWKTGEESKAIDFQDKVVVRKIQGSDVHQ